jgi:hypothetical protein
MNSPIEVLLWTSMHVRQVRLGHTDRPTSALNKGRVRVAFTQGCDPDDA